MAKDLLERLQLAYEEYDVRADPAKLEEMMSRANGARTIPQIFIHGRHVGGFTDLSALHRSGELDVWLRADDG